MGTHMKKFVINLLSVVGPMRRAENSYMSSYYPEAYINHGLYIHTPYTTAEVPNLRAPALT